MSARRRIRLTFESGVPFVTLAGHEAFARRFCTAGCIQNRAEPKYVRTILRFDRSFSGSYAR